MKKKNSTYTLVFAAVIIWIVVLFRFNPIQGDNSDKIIKNTVKKSIKAAPLIKEVLNLDYRDPFSKNIIKQENIKAELFKNSFRNKEAIWPTIMYSGYITNKNTGAISINLKVGENSFIARINQTIDYVTVRKITKDSVDVEFQGARKKVGLIR